MALPKTTQGNQYVLVFQDFLIKWPLVYAMPDQRTVPQVFRVDFLCFLVFFVCSESYFLQYSSEKSQSWQECRQVTPHHSSRVKLFSK